jgi:hypothetical protein
LLILSSSQSDPKQTRADSVNQPPPNLDGSS